MSETRKVVINRCFGGFGLSEAAYAKLIEWGVPVRAYAEPPRDPETGLYRERGENEGEVIFDRTLGVKGAMDDAMMSVCGRYWETWLDKRRDHPLLVRVVEEMGEAAESRHAELKVVEIPADIAWHIEEYDGIEHIAEDHRTWT